MTCGVSSEFWLLELLVMATVTPPLLLLVVEFMVTYSTPSLLLLETDTIFFL